MFDETFCKSRIYRFPELCLLEIERCVFCNKNTRDPRHLSNLIGKQSQKIS